MASSRHRRRDRKVFQRFDTKQADTHGIVYTPQPIVDFMVRSVGIATPC
jgi:predicted helicase